MPSIASPLPTAALACDVVAARSEVSAAIAEIAEVCARDVGQPLALRTRTDRTAPESVLTLRLPAALAAAHHPIWCLACRLACFCPTARICVLVEAEAAFSAPRRRRVRRRVAA